MEFFLFLPIGVIGLWRWSVWLFRRLAGVWYRPVRGEQHFAVSIVTPVYNEDPSVFRRALDSWVANTPNEIIAVIDAEDRSSIAVFEAFRATWTNATLIVTDEPGKRPALAKGITAARSPIVALVDSDTAWDPKLLATTLPAFADEKVGGVTMRQSVESPRTVAQRLFAIQLNLRYVEEVPFLAALGDALQCLSGRTALYRTAAVRPLLDALVHERFWGRPCVSGEDKRLTYLVQSQGWKVRYQKDGRVWTPGPRSVRTLLRQRLRWTRNSWRANLRALSQGWVYRNPALAFHLLDQLFSPVTTLLSPIVFGIALAYQHWIAAALIVGWWLISRAIKLFPHLKENPRDVVILPAFIVMTFTTSLIKLYALFTLNHQGWITRWHASRLPKRRFVSSFSASIATAGLLIALTAAVMPQVKQALALYESTLPSGMTLGAATEPATEDIVFGSYAVQPGDTLTAVAARFGYSTEQFHEVNPSLIPSEDILTEGQVLTIPDHPYPAPPDLKIATSTPKLRVVSTPEDHTIFVLGRAQVISLPDIRRELEDPSLLEEVAPGEWLLRANLHLGRGVTLRIEQPDVRWLKLLSVPERFVWLRSSNGALIIRNTKITSWDETAGDVDRNHEDGRSFVVVKFNARMDIHDSEMAYLGYFPPPKQDASTYGVSWKIPEDELDIYLLTGVVERSAFHHNYFGAYTYGATGMRFSDNTFTENVVYGLDPHDDSDRFVIERNVASGNGKHGIILSKRCSDSLIRDNVSFGNGGHGIMLDASSDNNLVLRNRVFENTGGLVLSNSVKNVVAENETFGNQWGIRLNGSSTQNILRGNRIARNTTEGIRIDDGSESTMVSENTLTTNQTGMTIASAGNRVVSNTVTESEVGIALIDAAEGNQFWYNTISNNGTGVMLRTPPHLKNYSRTNTYDSNTEDTKSIS